MNYINPRQKILWHTDKIEQLKNDNKTSAPVNVEIDLSNRCSHGCSWCHFAHTHTKGPLANKVQKPNGMIDCGDLMTFDLAISIIQQLKESGVQSITWTGGGEPTLHPNFDEIVLKTSEVGIEQGIYTHGGHINEERAAILKENMTFVYVSLDESNKSNFKISKGVDRFSAVNDGIDNLVAAKGKATVGIGFLIHPNNIDKIEEMVLLGKTKGVDYIQFRPIINYSQNNPNKLIEDTKWIDVVVDKLNEYENDPFIQVDIWRFRMYQNWSGHGYKTCNWSALQTVITPNGKMWRCVNKRGDGDALIGDLSKETFSDVWNKEGRPCSVNGKCRLMCRGHIANTTLNTLLTEPLHKNFI